jgi:hypothetical protein
METLDVVFEVEDSFATLGADWRLSAKWLPPLCVSLKHPTGR